jgi:predicted O-linked N-acetylglucosamine transferase (SPINDLY family)
MKSKKSALKQPTEPPRADVEALLALYNARRFAEAESRTRALLGKYPEFGFGWKLLGSTLQMQGKDALHAYQKTAQLLPDDPQAHYNLGNALKDLGQLDDAVASYRSALKIRPDSADTHINLGIALKGLGQLDDALASYRKAAEIKPDYVLAYYNLGNTQKDLGQLNDAVASYRRAIEIKPDFAGAHNNLGGVLRDLGQLDAALASYRRALELKPDIAEAHNNLGGVFKDFGQVDAALASYRRALELKPDFDEAYSNLLFLYAYQGLIDPDEYLAQASNWERACVPAQVRQEARHRVFQRLPLTGRRLKVGYVSGDYRQHAVSYFVEQLFAHHDRARVELYAYSTQGKRDAVTDRLQALAEHWVQCAAISDDAIREQIEADGIDVLIDLSGHSAHNRMGVFARRAAPVQAYYLGYFASTGLTEMDYWIGDEFLTPPETDSHFSEQVWRLPHISWSYEAKNAPAPAWHPDPGDAVWIGSFNNLGKLTPATLALWAQVLHALPEGRLLLKTKELADAGNRRRILDAMANHGIQPDRIELQDRSITPDWPAHMAYYNRLDIALDPVGAMGGVTTTCDTLWMAVPVITMQGDRVASRATAAILGAIGHAEWVARSEAEYIDKVVSLARDVQQRKTLRSAQRQRMIDSPLCDAKGLALSLENAYEEMFERWLQRQKGRLSVAS